MVKKRFVKKGEWKIKQADWVCLYTCQIFVFFWFWFGNKVFGGSSDLRFILLMGLTVFAYILAGKYPYKFKTYYEEV